MTAAIKKMLRKLLRNLGYRIHRVGGPLDRCTMDGAFRALKARKPEAFAEKDLAGHDLYSIVLNRRCRDIREADIPLLFRVKWTVRRFLARILPAPVKSLIRKLLLGGEKA